MRFITGSFLFFISIVLVSGCTANNEARDMNAGNAQVQNFGIDQNVYDESQLRVAKDAEAKVEKLRNVKQATVIVTNRQAYAAVTLETEQEIRNELENEIAAQVKSTDKTIQQVFISSDPDFADKMKGYREEIQEGRPVRDLLEEFNHMVHGVFPAAQ